MKDKIIRYINDPRELEHLYRTNKGQFKREFRALYPDFKGFTLADSWNERLNYQTDDINWGTRRELIFVVLAALVAGVIAKLPAILSINEEFFYPRNAGFVLFPILSVWFAWKSKLSAGKVTFLAAAFLGGLIFINTLPDNPRSDTLILSCIHLAFLLWAVSGFAFAGDQWNSYEKRLGFLKFNGDLVVITTLIVIASGILSVITIGLFSLIGFKDIEQFYFENIVLFGLPAAPILGTYLIQTNPQLVGKVSPVIAKIFSPLVLVMLVIYLVAIITSAKDPYNDRDFLLIYNALLIGVMAIIFFSVAESSGTTKSRAETWTLMLLSVVTIIVNGIALSAIVFRISEGGITPNRVAVLGSNVLILINLLLVTVQLIRVLFRKTDISGVGKTIAFFLPVYYLWAMIVAFLFPFLFGFK
jgi:hypothetical protein